MTKIVKNLSTINDSASLVDAASLIKAEKLRYLFVAFSSIRNAQIDIKLIESFVAFAKQLEHKHKFLFVYINPTQISANNNSNTNNNQHLHKQNEFLQNTLRVNNLQWFTVKSIEFQVYL